MAISYPLTLPADPKPVRLQLRQVNIVAAGESEFTGQQQVQDHAGGFWLAELAFEPMERADAEAWIALLMQLRGRNGTFLLPPCGATTPRGSAPGAPVVDNQEGPRFPGAGASAGTGTAWTTPGNITADDAAEGELEALNWDMQLYHRLRPRSMPRLRGFATGGLVEGGAGCSRPSTSTPAGLPVTSKPRCAAPWPPSASSSCARPVCSSKRKRSGDPEGSYPIFVSCKCNSTTRRYGPRFAV